MDHVGIVFVAVLLKNDQKDGSLRKIGHTGLYTVFAVPSAISVIRSFILCHP